MSKVKIVQIAMGGNDQEFYCEYLDDKGRVWHDMGKSVIDEEHTKHDGSNPVYKWQPKWEQIAMPDEPEKQEKDVAKVLEQLKGES